MVGWVVKDLRHFSDISGHIATFEAEDTCTISEIVAARPGLKPQTIAPYAKRLTTTPSLLP